LKERIAFAKFRRAALQNNTPKGVFFIAEVGICVPTFVLSLFLERRSKMELLNHSSIHTSRKISYCLLLLCLYVQATAQHVVDDRKFPDSLQQVLKASKTLKEKLDALFILSDFYSTRDTTKALGYARQGIEQSKRDEYLTGVAHFYLAGVYFEFDVDRSQQEYLYAEKLLRSFPQKEALIYRSRAWNNYGAIEQRKDKPREFLDILINKVLPLAQQAGDSTRMALSYHNIGLVLLNLNEYERSLPYFSRAIAIMEAGKEVYADLADTYVMSARATIFCGQPE
jgi:two-component system NarL family sensor kinase